MTSCLHLHFQFVTEGTLFSDEPNSFLDTTNGKHYIHPVRVISIKKLRLFWQTGHADAEQPLRSWYEEVKKANWKCPSDIKARYQHASLLGQNRVVFNIGGNKYRLVVSIRYEKEIVFIRFVGTHAQYNRIDAQEI